MGYIGRAATNAGSVNYLDDISSGFDGSDTTFTCAVKGTTITPGQENVYIYLDGVFQHPSDAYSISGSTITFTEAPVSGTDFTAYVAGEGAYLDDGTVSTAKLDDDAVTASKLDDDGTGFQVGDLGVGGSLTSGDKLTVTGRLRASGGIIGDLTGDVTGNVTGNTSGTAATVTGAAQSAITSVGTLTGLTTGAITQNAGVFTIKNASSDSNGLRIFQDSSDASKIYNNYNGTLQLGVGNTTALTIDSSENTTFAGAVTVTTATNYAMTIKSTDADAADIFRVIADDDGALLTLSKDASDDAELYLYDGSGNANVQISGNNLSYFNGGKVGIGTASPDSLIHAKVTTNTSETIRIQNDDSLTTIGVSSDGYTFHTYQHSLYWASWDGSTWSTKARMDSDGKLLIGGTTSRALSGVNSHLQVEGTTYSSSGAHLIGNTGTDASTAPILFFGRSRGTSNGSSTVVADDDRLGALFFCGADGTDINTPAATIQVSVDGTPGGNDMPGRIEFRTTADGASSTTERMRITSGGNVGIGETSPDSLLHISGVGDNNHCITMDQSGRKNAIGNFYSSGSTLSQMQFYMSNGNTNGSTNVRMRLFSGGELLVNRDSSPGGVINSNTMDGRWGIMVDDTYGNNAFIDFRDAGSSIGNITIVSGNVSYNTFIGSHYSSLTTDNEDNIEIGTVLSTIDETHTRHLAKFKISDAVGDTRVYGVFAGWDKMHEGEGSQATVSGLGATQVRVTGACAGGDLLESNGDGTAKVQSDDIIRSKTIGKVTIGDSDTSVKLVSCVLYCG